MKRVGTTLWKVGDGKIIDGFGPDGISARVIDFARRATRLQSGYVYHYAFAMLLGLVAIVSWVVTTGGA
jgi:NADH-quinone oxidoreductase subunit L